MTARERILSIRLLEKQERDPEYVRQIGVHVTLVKPDLKEKEEKEEKKN